MSLVKEKKEGSSMPYITRTKRELFDPSIALLVESLIVNRNPGELNYCISSLVDKLYGGGSYSDYNELMGVLACVQHEVYRRLLVHYEDKKCLDNGDVFWSKA